MKFSFYSKISWFILSGNSNRSQWVLLVRNFSSLWIRSCFFSFLRQGVFFISLRKQKPQVWSCWTIELKREFDKKDGIFIFGSRDYWISSYYAIEITKFQLGARAFSARSCSAFYLWQSWAQCWTVVSYLWDRQPRSVCSINQTFSDGGGVVFLEYPGPYTRTFAIDFEKPRV